MDTAETPQPTYDLARLSGTLPATTRAPLPPAARPSQGGGPAFNPRIILRGLTRHWWQALALWIVGTAAAAAAVYLKYEPIYRSSSTLQVEPRHTTPFGTGQDSGLSSYLQTQVQLIRSSTVLLAAANDPAVMALPSIRTALDAEQQMRAMLKAKLVPNSYLIEVAAESPHSNEAAVIVETVVDMFMKMDAEWSSAKNRQLVASLEEFERNLELQHGERVEALKALAKRSDDPALIAFGAPGDDDPAAGTEDAAANSRITVDVGHYATLQKQLLELEMKLVEADAMLESVRHEAASQDPKLWLEKQIEQAFLVDPDVQSLRNQMRDLGVRITDHQRRIRKASDPALTRLLERRRDLDDAYNQLWAAKQAEIRTRLAQDQGGPLGNVRAAERMVSQLRRQGDLTREKLEKLDINVRRRNEDAVERMLVLNELKLVENMRASVQRRLEELKFQQGGQGRIIKIADARPSSEPFSDKRKKALALTPLAMLGLVLGLVTLVEMRAGRVSGADDLSGRLLTEVFAVPPLPTARQARHKLGGPARDDPFEQFVQQLDHLRVALCGEAAALDGRGRCVLITSAVGGEGKTTLAAQLAVRCAEAGAKTVLIDADLRRATLGRLFEVPECPGLSDVLRGDAQLDDALVPISQVGGCHLLPAGSPEANPNRILRGPAVSTMLERLRKSFDVVVVDTSPILPVPDALILGRFADGVVLATRHDQSRYPAIERATHLLAGAGIPVLGVVVNGARPSNVRYGGYAYSARPDRAAAADSRAG